MSVTVVMCLTLKACLPNHGAGDAYHWVVDQAAALGATVLSIVMGTAALAKLTDLEAFRRTLLGYLWIPKSSTSFLSRAIPLLEAGVAVGVWIPIARDAAALLGVVLLSAFTVLLIAHLMKGVHIDCGCFGSRGKQRVTPFSVVRNLALIAAALAVLVDAGASGPLLGPVLTGIGAAALILVVDYSMAALSAAGLSPERR
jgi:hypothetical protein